MGSYDNLYQDIYTWAQPLGSLVLEGGWAPQTPISKGDWHSTFASAQKMRAMNTNI